MQQPYSPAMKQSFSQGSSQRSFEGRWMGVDLGDARVGIALSDAELTMAFPWGNMQAHGDSFHVIDDVVSFIEEQRVAHVVVGLPLQLNGALGASGKKARRWASNLERRMQEYAAQGELALDVVPSVVCLDERLTTVNAHHQLAQAQVSSRQHRAMVDQQSAVNILQLALNQRGARQA